MTTVLITLVQLPVAGGGTRRLWKVVEETTGAVVDFRSSIRDARLAAATYGADSYRIGYPSGGFSRYKPLPRLANTKAI